MGTQTHIHLFQIAMQETAEWVHDVQRETELTDEHYAFAALRATLHALRDELTADQIAHLSAQLPTLLRGVYFEGWDPSRTPAHDATAEAFLDRVRPAFAGYVHPYDVLDIVRATVQVLTRRMPGVMEKVRATLNHHVRQAAFGHTV
jgi:uncharacterized protein (DUF2267 family)